MNQLLRKHETAPFRVYFAETRANSERRVTVRDDIFYHHASCGVAKGERMILGDHSLCRRAVDDWRARGFGERGYVSGEICSRCIGAKDDDGLLRAPQERDGFVKARW
jgi:hypothetical protein